MRLRLLLPPSLLIAALCGCGDESSESDSGVPEATKTVLVLPEGEGDLTDFPDHSGEPVGPQPSLWLGEYDGRRVVVRGMPPASDAGQWHFSEAAESEWQLAEVESANGQLSFTMRFGGRLSGKLVRFEGGFENDRALLRGTILDGAKRGSLALSRQG